MKRIFFFVSACLCLTMNGCLFGIHADYETPCDDAVYWKPQPERSQPHEDVIRTDSKSREQ